MGLRAKGIENETPKLTYSGPSEDGSAQVQRNGGGQQRAAATAGGPSRRERREAARRASKTRKN